MRLYQHGSKRKSQGWNTGGENMESISDGKKIDGMPNCCAGFHVVWLCLYTFVDENKIQVMVTEKKSNVNSIAI